MASTELSSLHTIRTLAKYYCIFVIQSTFYSWTTLLCYCALVYLKEFGPLVSFACHRVAEIRYPGLIRRTTEVGWIKSYNKGFRSMTSGLVIV